MGKWNNRSRFQRRRSPMRWYSERHSSSSSGLYGDDGGIPKWEKRLCEEIGSVPWPKVVEATNFKSWYQGNVITWNDSACEETFNNEKRRFWSQQVNGIHSDISLPDPDLYITEVDWDTSVDPELIRDVERAYFAPPDDDVKVAFKRGRREKYWSGCNPEPVQESCVLKFPREGSDKVDHANAVGKNLSDHIKDSVRPWDAKPSFGNDTTSGDCLTTEQGRDFQWKTKERGIDSWENSGWDNSGNQNKRSKGFESVLAEMLDNPWEAKPSCRKETEKDNSWGDCSGKEGWEGRGWGSGGWEVQDLKYQGRERKEWLNKRYSQDFQEPKSSNPWTVGYAHGGNAGGWQTHRASEANRRSWGVKRSNDDWGRRNNERDDLYGYNSNYRNSRPRRDDYQNRKVNFSAKWFK